MLKCRGSSERNSILHFSCYTTKSPLRHLIEFRVSLAAVYHVERSIGADSVITLCRFSVTARSIAKLNSNRALVRRRWADVSGNR